MESEKNWYRRSYLQSRNRDTDVENKRMDTKGKGGVGGIGRLELTYIHYFFLNPTFVYLFLLLTVLGLRFCAKAFSSCGKRGPLFIAVHGPFTIAASLVAEHRLQMCRLSSCGSRA